MSSSSAAPCPHATVEVFAAACSGSIKLSGLAGLPLVHIDASLDAAASIRALNERHHGSAVLLPDFFQPLVVEAGWSDWAIFEIDAGAGSPGLSNVGVEISEGLIVASLPPGTTLPEFREQLHASLRHLRLQEAVIQTPFLKARSDACMNYAFHPRYTLREPTADFRGAALCRDLYAFDPADLGWRLGWIVVAARLAATGGKRPLWR